MRRRVDFPEPLEPRRSVREPRGQVRDRSERIRGTEERSSKELREG